ncbi:MotA/TolQ/ExbB proton channel family protein [Vibrio chaetopteri]|jgi:biopolymer transport protein ExbB/TolQ|uniref:MotA/TolQ/ExbB proton channel family protein n=1 Tax=Vibrio chaetopteri TaxID=3016528 RepID=UPI003AB304C9
MSLDAKEAKLRVTALGIMLVTAFITVVAVGLVSSPLEAGSTEIRWVDVLFDRSNDSYPITIQNLMWLLFAICLAELYTRWQRATNEQQQLHRDLLSDDESKLYRSKDLVAIFTAINSDQDSANFYLQRLVKNVITQFQINNDSSHASNMLSNSLDLLYNELDIKYNMVRYLVWVIPTLGFIGTVMGIAYALSEAGNLPSLDDDVALKAWVALITTKLGLAFNTTLLSLLQSTLLVYLLHVSQGREEGTLNKVGQYCFERLVNRLIEET